MLKLDKKQQHSIWKIKYYCLYFFWFNKTKLLFIKYLYHGTFKLSNQIAHFASEYISYPSPRM